MSTQQIRTEIAQRVLDHLLKQRAVSKHGDRDREVSGNGCAYRGMNGATCAVGCLIPDEHYDWDFEAAGINTIVRAEQGGYLPDQPGRLLQRALESSDIPTDLETLLLLQDLQNFHDRHYYPSSIGQRGANHTRRLNEIKFDHNLPDLDISGWAN